MIGWIIAIAIAAVIFWPYIIEFLQKQVLPWIRQNFAPDTVELIESLVMWLDNRVTLVRRALANAWNEFDQTLIGAKTEYVKVSPYQIVERHTLAIDAGGDQAKLKVVEKTIRYDDLPSEIRAEMIRRNTNRAVLNDKDVVRSEVIKRAAEEGISIEV